MFLLLLILESYSIQDIIVAVLLIAGGIFALRNVIFKDLVSGSKELLEIRTQERDEAKKENITLKEENILMRREINQRMEIWKQDQDTIKELQIKLKDKING